TGPTPLPLCFSLSPSLLLFLHPPSHLRTALPRDRILTLCFSLSASRFNASPSYRPPTADPLSGVDVRSYRPPSPFIPLPRPTNVPLCFSLSATRFVLKYDLIPDSLESVRTALGVLQAATALCSNSISQICIEYSEAVPWEDKEEEAILKVVSGLGPSAMSILARIKPVDSTAVKNIFISAFFFATSTDNSLPPFTNELKTSAQEQVEYMLMEDEDLPLITTDDDVKADTERWKMKIYHCL
ncbi:hypothetical protein ACLOJK_034732, partial [Asimina triloba]